MTAEGIVMLWMTQYQVLVMISAKGHSRDNQIKSILFKEVTTLKGQGFASTPHQTGINPNSLSLLYQGYIRNQTDKRNSGRLSRNARKG